MPRCLVLSDDLTGANATGVLLAKLGLRVATAMPGAVPSPQLAEQDVLSLFAETRASPPEEAYRGTMALLQRFGGGDVQLYSKRIDSTLRGNLGSELDAVLDYLGGNYTALVVPAYPQAGRIQVGGHLLVEGVPLHRSQAAKDAKTPILTSRTLEIFSRQTKRPIAFVGLEELENPKSLAQTLRRHREAGFPIILLDAASAEDIHCIAQAAVESGFPFISVDPGSFTGAAAALLLQPARSSRVLMVLGTANPVTKKQLHQLLQSRRAQAAYLDTAALLAGGEAGERAIRSAVDALANQEQALCILAVGGCAPDAEPLSFAPYLKERTPQQLSDAINTGIACATAALLDTGTFSGLYASGGDTAVAICKQLGALGVQIAEQVLPLAVYGHLQGGSAHGFPLVTKGGMVGGPDAMVLCTDFLLERCAKTTAVTI